MDIQKTGKYIREQRDKLGLSQNELSEIVHVTRQAVSNWENGKTLPDSDVLLSLSDLFQVTINEILCGESMEATVLELVDENNKKQNKYRRIVKLFSIVVSSLIVFILAFYFLTNYNSIKVYRVAANSNHFRIVDGMIISTSTNTYFKLGKIDVKNSENITVDKVKLYYKKGNKKEIIFENNVENQLYVDHDGYKELYRKKLNAYRNNLYLEITYNDTEKEVLKLELKEDFSNGLTVLFDESKVLKSSLTQEIQEKIDFALKEERIQYEKNIPVRNDIHMFAEDISSSEIKPIQKEVFINPVVEESKEEPASLEEPKEELLEDEEPDPIEEPGPIEPESMPEINFEEIIDIITTYGMPFGKSKQLEYYDNQKAITISYYRKIITIDSMNSDVMERITIKDKDGIYINYQRDENGVSAEVIEESLEELYRNHPELFSQIYNDLMLVYQEIN